jgi:uncharacterized protein
VTFLVACAVIVAASTVVFLVVGAEGSIGLSRFLPISLVTDAVLIGVAFFVSRPSPAEKLRLRRENTTPALVLAAVLGTLALGQVLDSGIALAGLGEYGALAEIRRMLEGQSGLTLVRAVLVIALGAGVAEEVFFRGYMQTRLVKRFRPSTAILITSAAFGLLHFDPLHTPFAFALGIWLGTVTERSGTIIPAIVAHSINNAVATLLAASRIVVQSVWINAALLALAFVVLVTCARYVVRPPSPSIRQTSFAPTPSS